MGDGTFSRRELMRKSGAAAGAAALVGSAGCIGTVQDAVPFVGGATYKSWLPEPGTVTDQDHYRFQFFDMNSIENNEDEFNDDTDYSDFENAWSPADVDWEDTNWIIFWRGGFVINADYDQESVAEDLEDEDYDDDTDHEGYTIYLGPNEGGAFAIDGSNLVLTSGSDPVGAAEDIIDTNGGSEDRYADESEDLNELIGALGDATFVRGRTMDEPDEENVERGRFDGMVARGRSTQVDGDTANGKAVVVYEDSDDVDTGDLEDWVEASQDRDGQFAEWDDISYSSNGRKGVIEGTLDTDEI